MITAGCLFPTLRNSGFVSLFPLLLVLVTLLALVASGDSAFRQRALNAVAGQVPLIGHQLAGNVHELRRSSVIGLAAGLLALTWGAGASRQLAREGRCGTCRGPNGPATCRALAAACCSWACSGWA